MIDCSVEIKHLQHCTVGTGNILDSPIPAFALSHKKELNFGEGYVYVTLKKGKVDIYDFNMENGCPPELIIIRDYFRSIPYKERIKLLKRLEKSLNNVDKYKL
jgi:hypothetical protein